MSQNRAVLIRTNLNENKKEVDDAVNRLRNRLADEVGELHHLLYPKGVEDEHQADMDWAVIQRVLLEHL